MNVAIKTRIGPYQLCRIDVNISNVIPKRPMLQGMSAKKSQA